MTERDIVDELREIQRMNTTLHGAQMAARAADEIERLRADRDLVIRLENLWQAYGYGIALEAAAEIKRLRAELAKQDGKADTMSDANPEE